MQVFFLSLFAVYGLYACYLYFSVVLQSLNDNFHSSLLLLSKFQNYFCGNVKGRRTFYFGGIMVRVAGLTIPYIF